MYNDAIVNKTNYYQINTHIGYVRVLRIV